MPTFQPEDGQQQPVTSDPVNPFEALRHVALGVGITRGGATFVPIYLPALGGPASGSIRTGDLVDLTIDEAAEESVPSVSVTNSSATPALLVEGETVSGGLQQRTFNTSILVDARSTLQVPVSCVEAGRWRGGRAFTRGESFAPTRVRRAKQSSVSERVEFDGERLSDQHLVWSSVEETLHDRRITSETRNIADADALFLTDQRLGAALEGLAERGPLPGQVGVIVFHGRRPVAAEIFGSTDLLRPHWTAIVRSYLIDATTTEEGSPSLDRAIRFLRRIRKARQVTAPGVGLGVEHHLRSERVSGQALTWDGTILHASAFALAA